MVFGRLADRLGRVRALSLSILLYSAATAGLATSAALWQLVAWRVAVGLGMGGEWSCGSVLVAETWPARASRRREAERTFIRRLPRCKQMDVLEVGALFEMAPHRVAHVLFKCREIVRLSEDRLANGARGVAAIGGFFDKENEIVHRLILLRGG
jgi:hypothetical protein